MESFFSKLNIQFRVIHHNSYCREDTKPIVYFFFLQMIIVSYHILSPKGWIWIIHSFTFDLTVNTKKIFVFCHMNIFIVISLLSLNDHQVSSAINAVTVYFQHFSSFLSLSPFSCLSDHIVVTKRKCSFVNVLFKRYQTVETTFTARPKLPVPL